MQYLTFQPRSFLDVNLLLKAIQNEMFGEGGGANAVWYELRLFAVR